MKKVKLNKKNSTIEFIHIALILVITLAVFACRNPFGKDKEQPVTGTLVINITGITGSKTILPQDVLNSIDHFDIDLEQTGFGPVERHGETGTVVTVSGLQLGDWDITVSGKDEEDNVIASGSTTTTITAEGPNQAEITLTPAATGDGGVQITFSWPVETGIDQVDVSFGMDSTVDIYSAGSSALFTKTGVDIGSHVIVVKMYSSGMLYGTYVDAVHVWAYVDTIASVDFLETELRSPPAAPTGLMASEGSGQIDLAWDASGIKTETGFIVERSETSGSGFSNISGTLDPNTEAWSDTTAAPDATYYYRVIAVNDFGTSDPSDESNAAIEPPVISGLTDDPDVTESKTWTWDSDDPAAEYIFIVDTSPDDPSDWSGATWDTDKTTTQTGGNDTYYIHVMARDVHGNESAVTTVSAIVWDDSLEYELLAYYPYNGDHNDASGNNNNGTIYGGVSPTLDRFGNSDSAYYFDGVDDYIVYPHTENFLFPDGITVTAWVKLNQDHNTTLNSMMIKMETFRFEFGDGGTNKLLFFGALSSSIEINQWYFVAGTYDNNEAKIYINGTEDVTYTDPGLISGGTGELYIGDWTNEWFNGSLDDIRFYNRALTQGEISELYTENGWTGNYPAPDLGTNNFQMLPVVEENTFGSFMMGSDSGNPDEKPAHFVALTRPYEMSKYEITNEQAAAVFNWALNNGKVTATATTVQNTNGDVQELLDLDAVDCRISLIAGNLMVDTDYENHPVVEMSWYGSVGFCNFFSESEGLNPCYDFTDWSCDPNKDGYRLPSEAEWEYAARGGNASLGYTYSGSNIPGEVGWYEINSGGITNQIGTLSANEINIFDMSGNVWEWVNDWYSSSYYATSPSEDPTGPLSGTYRVVRGGSCIYDQTYMTGFYRYFEFLNQSQFVNLGFRPARTLFNNWTPDYDAPTDVTGLDTTPDDGEITLNWTNPGSDFSGVLIVRSESSITWTPADHVTYSVDEEVDIGVVVKYAGPDETFTDSGLSNGTPYYYKVFALDDYKNYAGGVGIDDTPLGLIAEYLFDGNANDTSGYGNDGTVNGAVLTTDRFGNADSAYDFDGDDDYIEAGAISGADFTQDDFTISVWVKFDSDGEDYMDHDGILSIGVNHFNAIMMSRYSLYSGGASQPHKYTFGVSTTGTNWDVLQYSQSQLPPYSGWRHIVLTRAGADYQIFIDSILETDYTAPSTTIFIDNQNLSIGRHYDVTNSDYDIDGKIDDIKIFNHALSDQQIANLYHEGDWGYVEYLNAELETQGLDMRLNKIIDYHSTDTYRDMILSSYALAETEVTQGDYQTVMLSNPSTEYGVGDDYPVYYVSWEDAAQFCNDLSALCGLNEVYNETTWEADFSQNGFYLPTEAQWEYAAGGPDHNIWSLSDTFNAADYAFNESQTSTVKSHPSNGFGLFDMSGNIWEWCSDWHSATFPHTSEIDPSGPATGIERVGHGGYFSTSNSDYLKTQYRSKWDPSDSTGNTNGFRVAAGGFGKWNNQGSLEVNITEDLQNPIDITLSGYWEDLGMGESMTVSAAFSDTPDSMQWYLNWQPVDGETSDAITLGSDLEQGIYHLDLMVEKGDILSSEGIEFRVGYLGPGIGSWASEPVLTTARNAHSTCIYNNYIYVISGRTLSTYYNDILYTSINPDGSLNTWNTTSITYEAAGNASVIYNGFLYVTGGTATGVDTIIYAAINSDGTLGTWDSTEQLPIAVGGHTLVENNGFLYFIGGSPDGSYLNHVYYAELNPDGSIGDWTTTNSINAGRYNHECVIYNDFIYVLGGNGPTTGQYIEQATINPDGSVGTWSIITSPFAYRLHHSSIIHDGYLYIFGGDSGGDTMTDVQFAAIQEDGSLGAASTTTSFTTSRSVHTVTKYYKHIYLIGGKSYVDNNYSTAPGLDSVLRAEFVE